MSSGSRSTAFVREQALSWPSLPSSTSSLAGSLSRAVRCRSPCSQRAEPTWPPWPSYLLGRLCLALPIDLYPSPTDIAEGTQPFDVADEHLKCFLALAMDVVRKRNERTLGDLGRLLTAAMTLLVLSALSWGLTILTRR